MIDVGMRTNGRFLHDHAIFQTNAVLNNDFRSNHYVRTDAAIAAHFRRRILNFFLAFHKKEAQGILFWFPKRLSVFFFQSIKGTGCLIHGPKKRRRVSNSRTKKGSRCLNHGSDRARTKKGSSAHIPPNKKFIKSLQKLKLTITTLPWIPGPFASGRLCGPFWGRFRKYDKYKRWPTKKSRGCPMSIHIPSKKNFDSSNFRCTKASNFSHT